MIIGVDAGALSITDDRLKVGVYRVTIGALRALANIDNKNTYRLYTFSPIDPNIQKQLSPDMDVVTLTPAKGWMSVRLPVELYIRPVDVFLGMSQALPNHRGKSIGFVYDLGFLHSPLSYPGSQSRLEKQTIQTIKRSTSIVTISEYSKKDIVGKYGLDEKNVQVLYPGVEDEFTLSGEKYTSHRPYFLHVGALKKSKNIPVILQAYRAFLDTSKREVDLYLVGGDYWYDEQIRSTIESLHLDDFVKQVGFVSDEILAAYYRGAVATLAFSETEGFCLPAAEAIACGCPVLGSNHGAISEVAGYAGQYVNIRDIVGVQNHMVELVLSPAKRSQLLKYSQKQSTLFQWSIFGKNLLELIYSV